MEGYLPGTREAAEQEELSCFSVVVSPRKKNPAATPMVACSHEEGKTKVVSLPEQQQLAGKTGRKWLVVEREERTGWNHPRRNQEEWLPEFAKVIVGSL